MNKIVHSVAALAIGATTFEALGDGLALSPAEQAEAIEARGEYAKLMSCAQLFTVDHYKEYPDTTDAFQIGMLIACNTYLERYMAIFRRAPYIATLPLPQRSAILNQMLGEAVAAAEATASSGYRKLKEGK